ncbi:hypothetical protein M1M25_gp094 [Tenacibaculum phage Gundel_1]|uniref:Uncharacterized protein n=1 Tax=Tenacibaculum phage Gundel_1 TaxID=2745672 RepID=A0A8E4ZMX7_9CAUD|nr:hypothetical protein M1M25_gp094 [Tenacibaculum phage Gundel_1]QQV91532.1 hypothetical protein Gundel1_94 [Tenacibaculum phage Gundel_1]
MVEVLIKYGFLIKEGKIYDTKIQSYKLKAEYLGSNVIYYMEPKSYKRLYDFEPLLYFYSVDKVFSILDFNSRLRKKRELESVVRVNNLHYISNYSSVYNYPPSYLKPKKFNLYKICQSLKKRLD